MMKKINDTKGKRIKELRDKHGISQTELADTIGVSKQTMYKYENGIISNVPSDKIELLAKALDTTPAYLMGWELENGIFNPKVYPSSEEIEKLTKLYPNFIFNGDGADLGVEPFLATGDPRILLIDSMFVMFNDDGREKLYDYAVFIASQAKYKKRDLTGSLEENA